MGYSGAVIRALKAIKRGGTVDADMEELLLSKGLVERTAIGIELTTMGKNVLKREREEER